MANEKNKKRSNDDDKKGNRTSSTTESCKPSTFSGEIRNDTEKRSNDTSKTASTSPPSVASCYGKRMPKPFSEELSNDAAEKEIEEKQRKSEDLTADIRDVCDPKPLNVTNPFIEKMEEDILYHIALGNKSHDLPKMFGDIKFVVMGGTPRRMEQFAYYIANQIGYEFPAGTILNDISKNSHRYAMYKVGPVLSVSHGMGMPSIGILLHELIKLVSHAGIKDPTFFRIGTCGGFDKKAGTVVVSNKVLNDYMEPFFELAILGKKVRFPAHLNQTIVNEILESASPEDEFETVAGVTYCTDNFYEGSGRVDGAICEFSEQDSLNYYKELQRNGVLNVEMESLAFAALTCRAGIKSAVITVILSDRLETDQIKQPKEVLDEWQTRPQKLLAKYIKKKLTVNDLSQATMGSTGIMKSAVPPTTACKACKDIDSMKKTDSDCKSCAGTGTTVKPIQDALAKPNGSSPNSSHVPSVCKPCLGSSSKPAGEATAEKTVTPLSANTPSASGTGSGSSQYTTSKPSVCKPCVGFASKPMVQATTPSSTGTPPVSGAGTDSNRYTTSKPSVCKPCVGFTSKPVVEAVVDKTATQTSTSAPFASGTNSNSNQNTISKASVCKPCVGFSSKPVVEATSSSSTDTTSNANITSKSSVCKPCVGLSDNNATSSSGTTIKKSTNEASSKASVCKPCVGSSSKFTNETITDSTSAASTTSRPANEILSKRSACKPCNAFPVSKPTANEATPSSGTASASKSNTLSKSANEPICKPCVGFSTSTTTTSTTTTTSRPTNGISSKSSVCKPCVRFPSKSANETSIPSSTGSASTTSRPNNGTTSKSSVCKPCLGTTSKITPEAITNKPTNQFANDNSSVCQPCAGTTSKETTESATAKSATVAPTPSPSFCKKYLGPASAGLGNDSASKPVDTVTQATSKSSFECPPSTRAPTSTVESKPSSTKSASQDENQPGERKPSRCVPMKCFAQKKADAKSSSSSSASPKTYVAKDFDSSDQSTISNESWRSCYQKCSKVPFSSAPTSTTTDASKTTATITTATTTTIKPQAFHTPDQDIVKGVAAPLQPGPCCGSLQAPKQVTDSKGPCCLPNSKDSSSSDECYDEVADAPQINETEEENGDDDSGETENQEEDFTTRKPQTNEIEKDKENNANQPILDDTKGCPISIRTPCNYSTDDTSSTDVQSQTTPSLSSSTPMPQNETPVPSPETPDSSKTRSMPAFVTPTIPSCTKISARCSKFSNSMFANKEANKYDESPSPCAICKKYQESKNRNSSASSSDSQPEIIKCPHKLERLKDECQGYD